MTTTTLKKSPNDKSKVVTAKFSGSDDIAEMDSAWDADSVDLVDNKTTNQLIARGAFLIQKYQKSRTELLRELAVVAVSLRKKHSYKDMPDWGGNTKEYKDCIAAMYRKAGVDKDSESSMQKALRYHIGVVIRKVAPVEHLKTLGILETPQSQRQLEKGKGGSTTTTTGDSNKAMKGQGAKKEEEEPKKLSTGEPVPTTGGDNALAHLRIVMYHLEQASMQQVTAENAAEIMERLKQIADVTLTWASKVKDFQAKLIEESVDKASQAS